MAEDQHVPVGGFNAREAKEVLRRAYQESKTSDNKTTTYTAAGGENSGGKPAGPWASKPNHMASGQDFFVQLRKQMAALQQAANTNSA